MGTCVCGRSGHKRGPRYISVGLSHTLDGHPTRMRLLSHETRLLSHGCDYCRTDATTVARGARLFCYLLLAAGLASALPSGLLSGLLSVLAGAGSGLATSLADDSLLLGLELPDGSVVAE